MTRFVSSRTGRGAYADRPGCPCVPGDPMLVHPVLADSRRRGWGTLRLPRGL